MAGSARHAPDVAHELEDMREQQRAISGVLRAVARSAALQPVCPHVQETILEEPKRPVVGLAQSPTCLGHFLENRGDPEGAQYDLEHPH